MVNYFKKGFVFASVCFIMLFTMQANAQRERLHTPDPIDEFILEKNLLSASANDSLAQFYPILDSVDIYTISFWTLGKDFNGYYVVPKQQTNLPAILYNLSDDTEKFNLDPAGALKLVNLVPRNHAFILSAYYDQMNSPVTSSGSCKERNVITNLIDHLYLFAEIDPSRVCVKEAPVHP